MSSMFFQIFKYGAISAGCLGTVHAGLLALLTTSTFQAHVVYLHAVQMTWFKDLDVPEIFGFLHNQVSPFRIKSSDGQSLFAWHILPVGIYHKHEAALLAESSGLAIDIENRLAFKLLRDNPQARLILQMHGAGGTVASGYRCPNYRALSASDPDRTHVLTFDYRGFGRSTGYPSERGLILDAVSVVKWAMEVAQIPPERIVIYSQSLGTAVNIATAEYFASQQPPVVFAGHILTAPFVDVPSLVATYKIAGTIPILSPLARFPALFDILRSFITDRWSTKDRLATYVRSNEINHRPYRITILHAEDDYDIPFSHSETLYSLAVDATGRHGPGVGDAEASGIESTTDLGAAGTITELRTDYGVIRREILKYGLHDVIMGNPIVSLAVKRMFVDSE